MPIPSRDDELGYLPPGEHEATLEEVEQTFGLRNFRRREIMKGLKRVLEQLKARGVETVFLDGSFVTEKERPNDVDTIYVAPPGADPATWGLLSPQRQGDLRRVDRVHLWSHPSLQPPKHPGAPPKPLVEFFQTDRDDNPKGIVKLSLNVYEGGSENDSDGEATSDN